MEKTYLMHAYNKWIKDIEDIDEETYQNGLAYHYKLSYEDNMYRVITFTFKEATGKETLSEKEQVALFFAIADVMKNINDALADALNEDEEDEDDE